ncbi:MAG: NAD(P)/FAD-dependent oxidoreductase [Gammaproteobacteria bacterium]|nr:NAD(P)/FAD-dependent oxidoreductase [Gammaproteobacteria bacterium]
MNTIIVGAGISGLATALLLARSGRSVSIYDKRTLFDQQKDGRSINFTISGRGLAVLAQLGLKESVVENSAVLIGRTLHLSKSKRVHYKYGTQQSQVLLSIRRSTLVDILLNAVSRESAIHLHFGFEFIDIDESSSICHFLNVINKEIVIEKADLVIGADGVFSAVRSCMLKKQMASYQQTVFNWGYKEYQFDKVDVENLKLTTDQMHMWPKSNALLVAIPNTDGTFSVIFTAPLRSHDGALNCFDELVKQEYGDIVNDAPSFLNKSGVDPFNYIISIKIDKWHLHDRIILIGDSCHATYPFYGQGMNSALEDAVLLSDYMNNKSLSRADAFSEYEKERKKDTDSLHQLSEGHLHKMTRAMISPFWQACNMLDYRLAKLFYNKWVYEYEIVAHSTIGYTKVLDVIKKQNKKKWMSGFFLIASLVGFFIFQRDAINRRFYRKTAIFTKVSKEV